MKITELIKSLGQKAKAQAQVSLRPPHRGLVLSGGGSRASYQIGALRALQEHLVLDHAPFAVVVGSSIGAVNGTLLTAALQRGFHEAIDVLEMLWKERTFSNTFGGSISTNLYRSLRTGFVQYLAPGPHATNLAIFDPTPLRQRIDEIIYSYGGASVANKKSGVRAVGVMTTLEGKEREGFLVINAESELSAEMQQGLGYKIHYVNSLASSHALASAALPFVLPPAKLALGEGEINLVDGGISDNIPVDAAIRFGAEEIILIDTSGKKWWFDHYGQPHDSTEPWSVTPPEGSFCYVPKRALELNSKSGFGPVLKASIGNKTYDFVRALGPTWPVYKLLKRRMGEQLALEVMSYAVIHKPFIEALIELGYNESKQKLSAFKPLEIPQATTLL